MLGGIKISFKYDKTIQNISEKIIDLKNSIEKVELPYTILEDLDSNKDIKLFSKLHLIMYFKEFITDMITELEEHLAKNYQ